MPIKPYDVDPRSEDEKAADASVLEKVERGEFPGIERGEFVALRPRRQDSMRLLFWRLWYGGRPRP